MAKSKGKQKTAAAAAAAAKVEVASGNDTTIADPAPSSEPVEEISKAAAEENAAVLDDKSEGDADNNKEEETENGGIDELEGIEVEEEETKDGLDAKLVEEVDDVEEAKDGLDDKSEEVGGDNNDEDDDKSDGDEQEEDAKEEDGVAEPVGFDIVPDGGKMVDNDGKVEGEAKVEEEKDGKKVDAKGEEDTPNKKPKRKWRRKKKTAAASVAAAAVSNDAGKTQDNADKPDGGKMVDNDGRVEGEAKVEEEKVDKKDDAKGEKDTPNKKPKRTRRRKKKAAAASVAAAAVSNEAGKTQDNADKQGAPVAEELKMADGMGLVFMCNAKTKQDCFRYKVLGLPASKKEMVAKIYKGMRLFLFDVDLKLMYGIYKATSPGGYNIEPKAFNSAFPAQVRFTVFNDCFPLTEETFKAAIKENYYGKNKFNCQLSPEQVKKLCKLFQKAREVTIAEPELPPPARGRRKTRKAIREEPERTSAHGHLKNRKVILAEPELTSSAHGRKRTREVIRAEPERISSHGRKRSRHERERGRGDDNIPSGGDRHRYARREDYPSLRGGDHLYAKRREVYPFPPPPCSLALPPLPTYAYGQQGDNNYYRSHPPPPQLLDPRDYHRAVELEARPRQPVEYRDAYSSMYREPIPYNETIYMASASHATLPVAGLASSAYAPPDASLAPSAYAPPAASLAPSAYAPPAASLAPSAYAPSSSLYYRY